MHERQEGDSPLLNHPSVVAVRSALTAYADRTGQPVPDITVLPDAVRTAVAAADALGTTPAHIANSLIFVAVSMDGHRTPLLVMASGGARVDPQILADSAGLAALERADADFVRTETGFTIGGVAPVGHRTTTGEPLRTIVDVDLEQFDQIWAAAGHSHAVFPMTYADLLALTGGEALRVR
ncbi:MAG TPA: YbaK/EbsC family protein [Intrasporangiaceae bacterium]|nr:YbaK/EbsC family protein [Intrasporangiaceae bacterium]